MVAWPRAARPITAPEGKSVTMIYIVRNVVWAALGAAKPIAAPVVIMMNIVSRRFMEWAAGYCATGCEQVIGITRTLIDLGHHTRSLKGAADSSP